MFLRISLDPLRLREPSDLWALTFGVPFFEPLHSKPLKVITMKTLFLLSLAAAKRVGELQALLCHDAFQDPDTLLSYLPEFVAETESDRNPLPWSFLVKSIVEFVGDPPGGAVIMPC